MKFERLTLLWLIGLSAIVLAGCSVEIREASTRFQDTALPAAPTFDRVELPLEPELLRDNDDGTVVVNLIELEAFVEAAWGNEKVLDARETQIREQAAQIRALILLGRFTEDEAATFRQLYINEANHARLFKAGVFGVGTALLVLLGVAAL